MPDEVEFATKPALAAGMIGRALVAGVLARWAAGDEVNGADPHLRAECEAHGIGYVLAVAANREVTTAAGSFRVDELAARLPRHAWQRLSAGKGAKGEWVYDWPGPSCPTPRSGIVEWIASRRCTVPVALPAGRRDATSCDASWTPRRARPPTCARPSP